MTAIPFTLSSFTHFPTIERSPIMTILSLADHPEWAERAATWFHEKWQVPREVYAESIALSLAGATPAPIRMYIRDLAN